MASASRPRCSRWAASRCLPATRWCTSCWPTDASCWRRAATAPRTAASSARSPGESRLTDRPSQPVTSCPTRASARTSCCQAARQDTTGRTGSCCRALCSADHKHFAETNAVDLPTGRARPGGRDTVNELPDELVRQPLLVGGARTQHHFRVLDVSVTLKCVTPDHRAGCVLPGKDHRLPGEEVESAHQDRTGDARVGVRNNGVVVIRTTSATCCMSHLFLSPAGRFVAAS